MRAKQLLLSLALLMQATSASAVDEGFSGKVSLGYLGTSGNSESTSVNAGTMFQLKRDNWLHSLDINALGADTEGVSTAEAYTVAGKSEWSINDMSYLFGLLRWDKDKFSGYDQQINESIGYGRVLFNTDATNWTAEVGAGARQSDLRDGTSESETILRGATDFTHAFSDTAEFNAAFSVESGEQNTAAQSLLAVKARLMGDLALVASYRLKYNSDVPVGSENTDRFTTISLEYAF